MTADHKGAQLLAQELIAWVDAMPEPKSIQENIFIVCHAYLELALREELKEE